MTFCPGVGPRVLKVEPTEHIGYSSPVLLRDVLAICRFEKFLREPLRCFIDATEQLFPGCCFHPLITCSFSLAAIHLCLFPETLLALCALRFYGKPLVFFHFSDAFIAVSLPLFSPCFPLLSLPIYGAMNSFVFFCSLAVSECQIRHDLRADVVK